MFSFLWKSSQEEHNEGQADGSKADAFTAVVESLNPFSSPDYQAGFRNGHNNRPKDDD